MNLRSFFEEELWLFILIAIVLALAVPDYGLFITPYTLYFLLAVMFLTSLGIGLKDLRKVLHHKSFILVSFALIFVISPGIAFMFSGLLGPEMAAGLILYSAMPAAMANAFYMVRLGKDAALALVITALTTLAAPFISPLIVKLLTGSFIQMDMFGMFLTLLKVVIAPFIAAALVRQYAKRVAKKLVDGSKIIANACIFFVVFGAISGAGAGIWGLGGLALVMLAYGLISFVLGLTLVRKDRTVLAFSNGYRNGVLTIVIALEVFGPAASLVGVVATLVQNAVLVPIMFCAGDRYKVPRGWTKGKRQ